MAKKLVVFCDGTWNKADQKTRDGVPCSTNVLRLFEATQPNYLNKNPQIVHYIAGVGTRWSERISGGGFGYGISDNIKNAYAFIVSNYEPSDEIFLFGFSRGAFTARSIAGLIRNMGILRRDRLHLVNEAYNRYRDRSEKWHPDSPLAKTYRAANCYPDVNNYPEAKIAFLGLWDTVGALGAPFGLLISRITDLLFKTRFHDVKLSSIILSAYHALAIDERRWPFRPTLWELNNEHLRRIAESERNRKTSPYEQRWFPGVHSNVGGGYENTGLSDCALEWMAEKAKHRGLNAVLQSTAQRPFHPDPSAKPENSQTWYYRRATELFVSRQKRLVKWFSTPDDAKLLDNVQTNGDFIRPIEKQGNVAFAIQSFPDLSGYTGELSSCAIEKLKNDDRYRPPNVSLT